MRVCSLCCALIAVLAPNLCAQDSLQKELGDTKLAAHWIYDDFPKALAEAKRTAKPILVVLRCVPCPPGSQLDDQIKQPEGELEKLQKAFVCVRLIQAKGLDLTLFQYDFDQSFAVIFLNADGAVYGRYGTRAGRQKNSDAFLTLSSFEKAMERALTLHKDYPRNKAALAGKIPKSVDYAVPEAIPGLQDRAKVATTVKNCIHCHHVRENTIRAKWQAKKLQPTDLWSYPLPDNIGLIIDVDDGRKVKAVKRASPADKAGLLTGDELLSLNDQPLISIADMQWVLHTIPDKAKLTVRYLRKEKAGEAAIALSGNWRESDLSWRASTWLGLRQGLVTAPLAPAVKAKRQIAPGELALEVRELFGTAAKVLGGAGLKRGDAIVAVDGKTEAMTESQFLVHLRLKYGPEAKVKLTVLRGEQREELTVPMW